MDTTPQSARPRAYSYVRMSTDLQLKGDSLRRQREASRKYAEKHDLELVEDIDLHDIGISAYSGKNIASGNFGRFLTAVRDGKIAKGSYLLVESFDRMSRQEPIVALQPFMDIVNSGLVLVTLDDERVFSGKISFEDLIISIAKMSRANEESARKSDRLSQAWQAKRASIGQKKLTARCPTWLRLTEDRARFEIVDERAAVVRRIFDDAVAGMGSYTIVRRLNEASVPTFAGKGGWQNSTVNKILSSPAAIGTFQPSKMVQGKRTAEGAPIRNYFPRIISDSTFEAAQRGRLDRLMVPHRDRRNSDRHSGGSKGRQYANLFSKLAVCAYCKKPMRYENKGKPPKGRSYLVCSSVLRKFDCEMTGRWRYDHFETVFLSFVEQLDLASLVSSEEHSGRRRDLANQLEALDGRIKRLDDDLKRTFETSMKMAEFSSDFLATRIRQFESEIAEAKQTQQAVRHELAKLDETALTYYSEPDQMAILVDKVRSTRGGDVYKLRSQIASRLSGLIKDLQLYLPLDDGDYQQFEVNFRDGTHLMLFVDPADPLKIKRQIRGDHEWLKSIDEAGNVENYPVDDAAGNGH